MDRGWREAGLPERHQRMLKYAEKLTLRPREMCREDVEALRETGFSDTDILQIAQVTAYFNFVNRIADGLGVELESWFAPE